MKLHDRLKNVDRAKWLIALILIALTAAGALYLAVRSDEKEVWVPAADLPPYQLIKTADLVVKRIDLDTVPPGSVTSQDKLLGRYPLQPLSAGAFVASSTVVEPADPQLLAGTIPVPLPATAAMTYNGKMVPGTAVAVWTVSAEGEVASVLEKALVLDVQQVEGAKETEPPYVVVLSVPAGTAADLLSAAGSNSLTLTLSNQ